TAGPRVTCGAEKNRTSPRLPGRHRPVTAPQVTRGPAVPMPATSCRVLWAGLILWPDKGAQAARPREPELRTRRRAACAPDRHVPGSCSMSTGAGGFGLGGVRGQRFQPGDLDAEFLRAFDQVFPRKGLRPLRGKLIIQGNRVMVVEQHKI